MSGSCDTTVRIWNTENGKCTRILEDQDLIWAVIISGSRILAGNDEGLITMWDTVSWSYMDTLVTSKSKDSNAVVALSSHPHINTRIVSGSEDGSVVIWNSRSKTRLYARKEEYSINSVGFSPIGVRVVIGGENKTPVVWVFSPSSSRPVDTTEPSGKRQRLKSLHLLTIKAPVNTGAKDEDALCEQLNKL